MPRRLSLLFFLFLPLCLIAQVGTWKVYPAYSSPTKIIPAGKLVYVLASKGLYAYNTSDKSIQTFDRTTGLSSYGISDIAYSSAAGKLIVVYENENIDLIDQKGNITNLPDYYNKSLTEDKTVYSITISGTAAYLATGFGVVKVNMADSEVSESYFLGAKTYCVAEDDAGYIYAATTSGLYKAQTTANLLDKQNWRLLITAQFQYIFNIGGTLYTLVNGQAWTMVNGNEAVSGLAQLWYTSACNYSSGMMAWGSSNTYFIGSDGKLQTLSGQYSAIAPDGSNGYWASAKDGSLMHFTLSTDGTQTITEQGLKPDGPKYNIFGFLRFGNDCLYSVGGGYGSRHDEGRAPAIQLLKDGEWTILPDTLQGVIGHDYNDLLSIDYDPTDPAHIMVGGKGGLFEFRNGEFVKHYNYDNSPLRSALTPANANYTLVEGLAYGSDGTLHLLNSMSANGSLFSVNTEGEWTTDIKEEWTGSHYRNLIVDEENQLIWFVNDTWINPSLTCYQPSTGGMNRYGSFVNEDGTAVSVTFVHCAAKDLEGNIWIGTDQGPLMLLAEDIGTAPDEATFYQVKVPRNDGTTLADYLLSGVDITSIAIDGGGRKWFGTNGNGVYLVSADNMTQLRHFTSENSPLPSDDIESIAINGKTGDVFFGTASGLCSYRSDATETSEEMTKDNVYAYPNPVEPGYTGPITITGLSLGARVIIATSNGVKVAEGISNGGTFTWDGCDLKGRKVASGVYMVMAATSEGKKGVVCKVAIVR